MAFGRKPTTMNTPI
uniref:Uncharacterized protein n=1 Tax=Anguilla anguilla TaxID=7936 RepID=A0A0E9X8Y5_ANGAN